LIDRYGDNWWIAESALKEIGQPAVLLMIPVLRNESTNDEMRYKIAYTLRTMNSDTAYVEKRGKVVIPGECIPDLADTLRNSSKYNVQSEILMAMEMVDDAHALGVAVPVLVEIIRNPAPVNPDKADSVRSDVFKVLLKVDDEKALATAVPVLVEIMDGKYASNLEFDAINVLAKSGRDGIAHLVEYWKRDEREVGEVITEALAKNMSASKVQILIDTLKNPDVTIQKKTVNVLLRIRDKRFIPILVAALDEKNNSVRKNVLAVLQRLTGRKFGADSKKWKNWWEKEKDIFEMRWYQPSPAEVIQEIGSPTKHAEEAMKKSREFQERTRKMNEESSKR